MNMHQCCSPKDCAPWYICRNIDTHAVHHSVQDSMESVEGYDARVIECLQDFKDELVQPECKAQVHKLTSRASQDIRFDEPLADACFEDRSRLCDEVQPVSSRHPLLH